MGIMKVLLVIDLWLLVVLFQEIICVLIDVVINCCSDKFNGLKENVIIGKLILVGIGINCYCNIVVQFIEEVCVVVYIILLYEDQYYSLDFGVVIGVVVLLDDYGYSDYCQVGEQMQNCM